MAANTLVQAGSVFYLALHLLDGGAPVVGQSPTVEIRRARDGRYFDWSVSVAPFWKTVGGQKNKVLTEKVWKPGLYQISWDQQEYDEGNPEVYTAVFRNTDPDYLGEEVEYITFYVDLAPELSLVRKLLTNKSILDILTDTTATHTWLDDDKSAQILKHNITISGSREIREPE